MDSHIIPAAVATIALLLAAGILLIPIGRLKKKRNLEKLQKQIAESQAVLEQINRFFTAFALLGLGCQTESTETMNLPTLSQVRACYARLLKEAHPDTAQDEMDAPQAAQQIARLASAFNKVKEWYGQLEEKR